MIDKKNKLFYTDNDKNCCCYDYYSVQWSWGEEVLHVQR